MLLLSLGNASWDMGLMALLGLLIGSFLNVVIHRLPLMLEADWKQEANDLLKTPADAAEPASPNAPAFNLITPRSRCPQCAHHITWYENIPVLSYVALRGKCSACAARISPRYPAVELLCASMFMLSASHYGLTMQGLAWAAFAAMLIAQLFIDFDTMYLPDDLNYLILWLGLIVSALGWTVPLSSAVWAVVAGYLSLWVVYHVFKLLTGKEGMGYGDFKLFAALGAWFGAGHLIALILLSSLVGSIVGGALLLAGRIAHKDVQIPFGPFLAGAGLVGLALGPGRLEQLIPFAFPLTQLTR